MKLIEKFKQKTEGLSNREIAREAALMVKSRLIHRYRRAKSLLSSTEITDEKLFRSLSVGSADLLYHLLVLWAACGITPADVAAELTHREGTSGIDEKRNRKK